jgi:hypothetical protein
MKEEIQGHGTSTSIVKAIPAKVDAGNDVALKIKVACPSKCNLQSGKLRIVGDSGAILKEIELVSFDGTASETDEFVVKTPNNPGEYRWTAVFAAQEKQGILHEESSAPCSFIVKPHATSMAVWDVPSPIVLNNKFAIKVGVQCSAECKLAGRVVEIYDHEQTQVATATLNAAPLSATSALYWAEVDLQAPSTEGSFNWTAKFLKPDLELAHEQAAYPFAFGTVRPSECTVTVEAIDKEAKTPILDAQVVLHPYRGFTDERGIVKIEVARGEYALWISTNNKYRIFRTNIKVVNNMEVKAELVLIPDDPG